jgi:UDP-N-acetylglucosamine transferase subunit ALG13
VEASGSRAPHYLCGITSLILVTVGTQLPFERLIRAVDAMLDARPGQALFQIGNGNYEPRNGRWQRVLAPAEFNAAMTEADVVVSHAGIGTILSSRKYGLPAVLMPRLQTLGEHRNDHQTATARSLSHLSGVYVAWNESELVTILTEKLAPPSNAANSAPRQQLMATLTALISASG